MIYDPLLPLLRDPGQARHLDEQGWDPIIRLARSANLIARLAEELAAQNLLDAIPAAPRQHLLAARVLAARQHSAGIVELLRIRQALATSQLPTLLLKGAAYLAAELPLSRGRLFGDIDLLFQRTQLAEAESALALHGWNSGAVTAYDQRYYRQWMHELPPLTHFARHSVLDVHHNILPSTARHPPDAQLLINDARELAHLPGIYVLAPVDMFLHSACHLFHEGEFHNGLRDLCDLDQLFRYFSATETDFWPQLKARAAQLHLQTPLNYALSFCHALLETPLPPNWPAPHLPLMRALYLRALRAPHPLCNDAFTPLARWLLYVRAHWLRMPPHLLSAHLARKAWLRISGLEEGTPVD